MEGLKHDYIVLSCVISKQKKKRSLSAKREVLGFTYLYGTDLEMNMCVSFQACVVRGVSALEHCRQAL